VPSLLRALPSASGESNSKETLLRHYKFLLRRDFIFRADPSASLDIDLEDDDDMLTETCSNQLDPDIEKSPSWDGLWLEDDDNDAATES
jgi:hypothetical protein